MIRQLLVIVYITCAFLPLVSVATDQAPLSSTDAVEAGGEALLGPIDYPWLDAEGDLALVPVTPHKEVDSRNQASSTWELAPWDPPDWDFTILLRVLYYIFISLAILIPVCLVGLFVWILINSQGSVNAGYSSEWEEQQRQGELSRVENLPVELKRARGDLLGEARRLYEAGNYRDAIIYLFSHQLIMLDRHQFIRLTKGKTNRHYLQEVRRKIPDVKQLIERTMIAFEDVFFGDHPLERSRFEACWNEVDEFHARVEEGER